MGQMIRIGLLVLVLSLAGLLAAGPWLLSRIFRFAGAYPPSYRRRLFACLSAAPAFAAALVLSLGVHKLLGVRVGEVAAPGVIIWLLSLAAAVAPARWLMVRELEAPSLRPMLWGPVAVSLLALAGGFVSLGRVDYLLRQRADTEVALRELAASLESHRAEQGGYPTRLSELENPPRGSLHYVPLPAGADEDLIWAWRVVDVPPVTAVAVLTSSGDVRWVRQKELSLALERSIRFSAEDCLTCPGPEKPPRPDEPETAPAPRPAASRP